VPFGLVRYGVAPDHHSIRSIRNTLERTLENPCVRFYGDVAIGSDLSIAELRESVDAVIYAYGAGSARGVVLRPSRRTSRYRPARHP
jgi:ferredoxin--NADP+ reductase